MPGRYPIILQATNTGRTGEHPVSLSSSGINITAFLKPTTTPIQLHVHCIAPETMLSIPWKQEINFASALLLHSCITVFLKETSNSLAILYHVFQRSKSKTGNHTSVVLDGYTSVFSRDRDGELAELYFTNTGFLLLLVSLASAITMNLHLPIGALNTLIGVTFGLTFIASMLVACKGRNVIMPIMALRRAGRFIWSDTPFVNFFSLIYIAVVLKGSSKLALRDYVVFRSIAILELVFMKARLAAADVEMQQTMLRRLVDSEYVLVQSVSQPAFLVILQVPSSS
ncbi:hypothetical protein N0V94_007863 [Neodidymelliopsis sp. IMI 364377]|nr:hypothetical protein N0V94_007863 [Neodidymelliopsis sp. IMI 364377]